MTLPQITATGNIVNDPDLAYTASGIARLKFRIACNERKRDENGKWIDGRSTFLGVTVWRRAAEEAAAELKKGDEVVVGGRLVVDEYTDKDGNQRQGINIEVDTIGYTFGRRDRTTVSKSQNYSTDEEPF